MVILRWAVSVEWQGQNPAGADSKENSNLMSNSGNFLIVILMLEAMPVHSVLYVQLYLSFIIVW